MPKIVTFFNLVLVHQLYIYTLLCFHPTYFTYNQNLNFEDKGHHKDIFPKPLIIKKKFTKQSMFFILYFNIHVKTILYTCKPNSSF
jgi:hypothetical protein